MVVTFCGHRDVPEAECVKKWLYNEVELLMQCGATVFLLGGYGEFDRMAASVVWDLKKSYPDVKSILVLPYPDKKVNDLHYDCTEYPELENVPKRYAISHRNRYMVDQADVVVAYVTHEWGGAAQTLKLAKRKGKRTIICDVCGKNG